MLAHMKPPHTFPVDALGHWTSSSARLLVLSGAGLSVASGVPTYRSKDGLWLNHSIDQVCNFLNWTDHVPAIEQFYQHLWDSRQTAQPNIGHLLLDNLNGNVAHYTQNVDGLCAAIPLHGQLANLECVRCGWVWEHNGVLDLSAACPQCGTTGGVKPGVVFFHQHPPAYQRLLTSLQELRAQDVLAVVGTSGEVIPIVAWCHMLGVNCQKWLYNTERSDSLPEAFFHRVVLGPFEQTCFDLKDRWQQHSRAARTSGR